MTAERQDATRRWSEALASWAVPDEILAQAPESPWGFAPQVFADAARVALTAPPTPTHRRCAEVLPPGGTVLDVGAGGGAASLPLAGVADLVVAVDESSGMLDELVRLAGDTVRVETVVGRWPDVADQVPQVDVVLCANVVYNVAGLDSFVAALSAAARVRVVLELTAVHPLSWLSPLWQHFWGLTRPTAPVADDALAVVTATLGVTPATERWHRAHPLAAHADAGRVEWVRRRLCLTVAADAEIAGLLTHPGHLEPVEMVTAWWAPRVGQRS